MGIFGVLSMDVVDVFVLLVCVGDDCCCVYVN